MNKQLAGFSLLALGAVTLCLDDVASASGSGLSETLTVVSYGVSGSHSRQPRSGPAGTLTPIGNYSKVLDSNLASGATLSFPAELMPATLTAGSTKYTFAFANVSGGAGGSQTSTTAGSLGSVTVGSNPINIVVVYLPVGGGGCSGPCPAGPTGATIDQFDEATGTLLSDTFVQVTPATLSSGANTSGWVPTSSAVQISAWSQTSPSNVAFDKWVTVSGSGTISGANLSLTAGQSINALALYTPMPAGSRPVNPQTCAGLLTTFKSSPAPSGVRMTTAACEQVAGNVRASLAACLTAGYVTPAQVVAAVNTAISSDGCQQPSH
jgi:hypothetical protein